MPAHPTAGSRPARRPSTSSRPISRRRRASSSTRPTTTGPTTDIHYGQEIARLTGGKHFIVQTDDNGRGPLVPSDRKDNGNEDLCNPAGRGVGPLSWDTGYEYVDGFLWFNDPGNSDGPCGAGDPGVGVVLARLRGRADPARDQRDPRPTREPDEVQHQHVATGRRVADGTRTCVLSGGRACM